MNPLGAREIPRPPRIVQARSSPMELEGIRGRVLFPGPQQGPWPPFERLAESVATGGGAKDLHTHSGEEVVNYVLAGAVLHWDSEDHAVELNEGAVTLLRATDEIRHDIVPKLRSDARWVSVTLHWTGAVAGPETPYQFGRGVAETSREPGLRVLRVVGASTPVRSALGLDMSDWTFSQSSSREVALDPARRLVAYVLDGTVEIEGRTVASGGGILAEGVSSLRVAASTGARMLLMSVPAP